MVAWPDSIVTQRVRSLSWPTRLVYVCALSFGISTLGYYIGASMASSWKSPGNPLSFEGAYWVIIPMALCMGISWRMERLSYGALANFVAQSAVFFAVIYLNRVSVEDFKPMVGLMCITLVGPNSAFLGLLALRATVKFLLKPRSLVDVFALVEDPEDLPTLHPTSEVR